MKYHYTYMIEVLEPTDSRKYYIGVRTSGCKPEDDNYFSSSKHLKAWLKKHGKSKCVKTVLARWETRQDAVAHEIFLHDCFNVSINDTFFNKCKQTSVKFDTSGVSSYWKGKRLHNDTRKKMSLAKIGKPTWQKGKPCSEEQKEKIRKTKLKNKYKHDEKIIEKMKIQTTCPHCNLTGRGSAMNRWHFNNCKHITVV